MKNQTMVLFKKTLTASKNLQIVVFFMLVFLASCTNNTENKEGKAKEPSVVENGSSGDNSESQNNVGTGLIYQNPEIMPEFPGGLSKFMEFLNLNINYPEWEKRQKIEGRVFVTFVVEKDGSTSTFQVARMPPGSINLGNEAVRVLRLMPNWIPGKIEGKKVRVSYAVPILFKLP